MTAMTDLELRETCHSIFAGHKDATPAATFAAMAEWCAAGQVAHDVYGEGPLVQDFEKKIAALLGFESTLFCITGTITQVTALRLACVERTNPLVALHPSAHIIRHENSNYQLLDHFKALQVGDPHRPWRADDLTALADPLGAALVELPMRELGGQLPEWAQLDAIKAHCADRNIHLHMDGARLWEAAAGYDRSLQEIASGFDSVYVSFYKGINGLGGAMLLGRPAFIAKARTWIARQGGNLFHRTPYVVAAAMQFDQRLAAMSACFKRTEWLYSVLRDFPQLIVNPARPQSNMLHLYLPVGRERALAVRDQIAQQHRAWMFGRASHSALPNQCVIEWYVGDNLLNMPDHQVRHLLQLLADGVGARV
jgi:threonine aldolase